MTPQIVTYNVQMLIENVLKQLMIVGITLQKNICVKKNLIAQWIGFVMIIIFVDIIMVRKRKMLFGEFVAYVVVV